MKTWWAQTRAEVRMTIQRGETLLLTLGIPVGLLVFFSLVKVTNLPAGRRVDFLAPGILALCVLSTSLVALSIATGFERSYGVLRRLHVTPLGRPRLIAAKLAGVLVTEALQVAVLAVVAVVLGWQPRGGVAAAAMTALALVLGSAGCVGIGLLLAGRLRAEVNLAASNGLYLLLLLFSGIVVPLSSLPSVMRNVVLWLPSAAMADVVHHVLGSGITASVRDWIVLSLWALVAPLLAARTFRFD
jgi:ABC-2 type transport system permease protein